MCACHIFSYVAARPGRAIGKPTLSHIVHGQKNAHRYTCTHIEGVATRDAYDCSGWFGYIFFFFIQICTHGEKMLGFPYNLHIAYTVCTDLRRLNA